MRRFAMAFAALMVVGVSAQAQVHVEPPAPCPSGVQGTENESDESRVLNLNGAQVDGCLVKPVIDRMPVRGAVKFNTLIKVRANFAPELSKSVEQL